MKEKETKVYKERKEKAQFFTPKLLVDKILKESLIDLNNKTINIKLGDETVTLAINTLPEIFSLSSILIKNNISGNVVSPGFIAFLYFSFFIITCFSFILFFICSSFILVNGEFFFFCSKKSFQLMPWAGTKVRTPFWAE